MRGASRRCAGWLAVVLAACIPLSSAQTTGAELMRLRPCPDSPNCVSSDAQGDRAIAPFTIRGAPELAWQALERRLTRTERVKIVASEPGYLHAEFTTRLLRFTDDVEFELRPQPGVIAVRSASRVGYYDFGANRKRLEGLREALRAEGVLE
jgi:uncharacterized protein (DUF1499 family)